MKQFFIDHPRAARFATGVAAAALAAGPLKRTRWKYPLYALAGASLARGVLHRVEGGVTEPREQAPERVHADRVGDLVMRWEDHGKGAAGSLPVVMVHGLPTNPRVWRYVVPELERANIRCLCWEQVGFGGSMDAGLSRDLSIPRQAEYLHRWLQHMGIDKAIFVGHDYGGGVVQRLLVDHPEYVAGVVLADSVAFDNWPVPAVRMAQAARSALEFLPPMMIKPLLFAAIANLHATRSIRGESFATYWGPYDRPIGPAALAHQLGFFHMEDTEAVGQELEQSPPRVPARVLWGEKDPLNLASAGRLAEALNAPLTIIPGGRHFTVEDHPEVIASAIIEIAKEASNSSASAALNGKKTEAVL